MTATEIKPLIESQYIDLKRSNMVETVLKDGSISYGEFLKYLQEDIDMQSNRWLFSSMGLESLLYGDDIESITPI